jgi:hypothetical protein
MAFNLENTVAELQAIALDIFNKHEDLSESQKSLALIDLELERLNAAIMRSIISERDVMNKPVYSNDVARQSEFIKQQNLSPAIIGLLTDRLNAREAINNLEAYIERKRKEFRIAELQFLYYTQHA